MRRTIILVLALGVLPIARVAAQQGLRVPGEPVRVTAPGVPNDLVVSVVAVVADTLVVEHGPNTWRVPITSITRLEVKRGRKSHGGRGAAVGGLLGLVGGAVWGAVECSGQEDFIQYDPGTCAAIGGLVFGLGGLLAGAIIGSLYKTSRWTRYSVDGLRRYSVSGLRITVAPQRDGRFAFGLSVAF